MTVRVKICGITSGEDAQLAVEAGADALGFIQVPGTPRYIEPNRVREIVATLPPFVTPVLVFADRPAAEVESVAAECGAGVVQLHGGESPGYCTSLRRRVIKAIRVRDEASLASLAQYRVDAFLLDTFAEEALGGTGRPFPWELAQQVRGAGRIILSGGLTPETVGEAIRRVRPYGVDVSSGVEARPGRKDPKRLQEFIRRAREAA